MARLYVIAGTNGAGKSSVAASLLFGAEATHFDPDAVAAELRALDPTISVPGSNAAAWRVGVRLLRRAIDEDLDLTLETTLGGTTIVGILEDAARDGHEVRILYLGLTDVEMHLARVASRVAAGGHDIPAERIRERFDRGREHLIRLIPLLEELRVIDNSAEGNPNAGEAPRPFLVFHLVRGEIVAMADPMRVPGWAKPIAAAALDR